MQSNIFNWKVPNTRKPWLPRHVWWLLATIIVWNYEFWIFICQVRIDIFLYDLYSFLLVKSLQGIYLANCEHFLLTMWWRKYRRNNKYKWTILWIVITMFFTWSIYFLGYFINIKMIYVYFILFFSYTRSLY